MAEQNFREKVYDKCLNVVRTHQFPDNWDVFLKTRLRVGELFNDGGPSPSAAQGLSHFKKRLRDESQQLDISIGERIVQIAKAGKPYSKWNARAAFMKVLLHFSRRANRDAQEVWIYSPPEAYWRWIFDLLNGTDAKVLMWLAKDLEVYSENEKTAMVNALQIALQASQKVVHSLGNRNEETLNLVKRWFAFDGVTSSQVMDISSVLLSGFKAISNICNSSKLIFADDPSDRKSMSDYVRKHGSVYVGGEKSLNVMYLAGAFKKSATSGQLWLCVQTIIHEASHIAINTRDILYDKDGLKPRLGFGPDDAIKNADSWGYFAIDAAGFLSASDRKRIWTEFGY